MRRTAEFAGTTFELEPHALGSGVSRARREQGSIEHAVSCVPHALDRVVALRTHLVQPYPTAMKGVVCWLAVTVDVAALQTFERGAVTLDGEDATALVPVDVLKKKP